MTTFCPGGQDELVFKSVCPACWPTVSAASRKQLELLEQWLARISQDRLGLPQSSDLVCVG